MSDDAIRWIAILFVVALGATFMFAVAVGLHRRHGVRHQMRNVYCIAVATVFLAIALVLTQLQADVRWSVDFVAKAAITAALLSGAAIGLTRASYTKLVVDGVYLRRQPAMMKFALAYVTAFFVLQITGLNDRLFPLLWPYFVGGTFALLFLTVFSYWHVAQLERALGHPLFEAPAPDSSQS